MHPRLKPSSCWMKAFRLIILLHHPNHKHCNQLAHPFVNMLPNLKDRAGAEADTADTTIKRGSMILVNTTAPMHANPLNTSTFWMEHARTRLHAHGRMCNSHLGLGNTCQAMLHDLSVSCALKAKLNVVQSAS